MFSISNISVLLSVNQEMGMLTKTDVNTDVNLVSTVTVTDGYGV